MIIRLIAENEAEEARLQGEERDIVGVKEYLFFGNKVDEDDNASEFHEWHGGHKYLMTNLNWFYEMVSDERKTAIANSGGERMIKRSALPKDQQNIETLSMNKNPKTIKFPEEIDAEEVHEPTTLEDE